MNTTKPLCNLASVSLAAASGTPTLQFYYPESDTIVAISCTPQLGIVTTKLDCLQYRVIVGSVAVRHDVATAKYYAQRALESIDIASLGGKECFLQEVPPRPASEDGRVHLVLCVLVSKQMLKANMDIAKMEAEAAKIISDLLVFDEADLQVAHDAIAGKTGANT